jgi:hypothetical protein
MLRSNKLALAFLWSVLAVTTAKKDHNAPHPHTGKLASFAPGPFKDVKLTKADENKLAKGEPVMKQTKADNGGSGSVTCVQDVQAPPTAVWYQILNLDAYKGKVPKVVACKNYKVGKNKQGRDQFKTKMVIGVMPGYSVSLFLRIVALY